MFTIRFSAQQVVPVLFQRVKGFGDLFVRAQFGKEFLRGLLVDDALLLPLFFHRQFHIAQHEVEFLFLALFQVHLDLVRRHGLPAGGDGVAHLAGGHGPGILKAVVHAEEGFHIRVEPVNGGVHGVEGIVVPPLPVFGFVVNHAVLHLNLARGEVPLEVQHIVLGVPQAEFHETGQDHVLRRVRFVRQGDLVHFGVKAHGHEAQLAGLQAVLFAGDDGVAHAMAAGVFVQLGFHGFPPGVPHRAVVVDVEIPAAVVNGHVVVAVAGNPAQAGVTVEAVASGGVADDAEEFFAPEVVDPGIGRAGCLDDILPRLVVKVAEFHGVRLPSVICPFRNGLFVSITYLLSTCKRFLFTADFLIFLSSVPEPQAPET